MGDEAKKTDKAEKETEELKEEQTEEGAEVEEAATEEKQEEKQEEDFKAKYFYLAAEMDNLRKRHQRERDNLIKYGNEKVLSSLLEVIDNLDRTIGALGGETDEKIVNIVSGVDMVRGQFLKVLEDNGLTAVETEGQIFDPNFHEAMAQQPAEDKKDQEIITEYQKGYILNGRLLRAAKVVIAKND